MHDREKLLYFETNYYLYCKCESLVVIEYNLQHKRDELKVEKYHETAKATPAPYGSYYGYNKTTEVCCLYMKSFIEIGVN